MTSFTDATTGGRRYLSPLGEGVKLGVKVA